MTALLSELGGTARNLARQGVVVTVVLTLALGITASLAVAALERSPSRG
ncbi:MAG TPA: hypothetical protein VJN18_30755 [Polyangiaceae bacterium]|nr:hypothetical protein [Polyangiaceae bacterium]